MTQIQSKRHLTTKNMRTTTQKAISLTLYNSTGAAQVGRQNTEHLGRASLPHVRCASFSHGDSNQLQSCTRSWPDCTPKCNGCGGHIIAISVQCLSDILLCTVLECEKSPRASNQVPPRPSSSSCQAWARCLSCHCEGVWSNLQVILTAML
jgi:hypothetical protein